MKWEEKAEWLQRNGYPLAVYALASLEGQEEKWAADIDGEVRRYAATIGEAVDKVYELIEGPITSKTILDDYETEPIDYTGCHPVIAEALNSGLMIKCKVSPLDTDDFVYIDLYARNNGNKPYCASSGDCYSEKELTLMLKKKTETRVKDPVEVMQWLVGNGYEFHADGRIFKGKRFFNTELWSLCGKTAPEGWQFPELLETV